MGKLDRKTVIITGASGGIGAASAALFSREGAQLVLTGRDEVRLREAAAACDPTRTRTIVADASDEADAAKVVELARSAFAGLDVLFANAGIEGMIAPLTALPLDELDRAWRTNVRGTVAMMQQAIPLLIAQGGGSIVVSCSTASMIGSPGITAYAATKSALLGIIRTAALELASQRVRVNAIAPSGIDNRMMHAIAEQAAPGHGEALLGHYASTLPMGRLGTNEEVAKAALFLACDDSSFCTGSTLVADGGQLAM
ncbi:SDR family NAD(P)-dependent oxidoreductase [Nannocystaceae bacterium ST9]